MKNQQNIGMHEAKKRERLLHVKSHAQFTEGTATALDFILKGVGNRVACAGELSDQAMASGIVDWFENNSIEGLRQHFYVAAKLDQFWYPLNTQPFSPLGNFLHLLKPLVSNNRNLIEWFVNYEAAYDPVRVENHKTGDFFAYQAIVALKGDWTRLLARCEKVMSDPPGASRESKYLIDHRFYYALAQGDISRMKAALEDICAPKVVRSRHNDESGFTDDFIFTPAVIYSKIARYHGYEVEFDNALVPAEWLSMEPLSIYHKVYSFLDE